eukprot:TRINITY_DN84245_c0_g1_i1.p1 TRINITY_DN84245_c0_g1~~TRINITY_DN84245_c0_g1_i1.p1  ORF type:complete len:395 (+),score=65.86 TRINITY_DN84245_c0_g1_i1:183-1367(+)
MSFRVAHFNILGRHMAGTMWFHYARDFLPTSAALGAGSDAGLEWTRASGLPKNLLWTPTDRENNGPEEGRFYRFQVLLAEIKALRADILCLVELDCFAEFKAALEPLGYDGVFKNRVNKQDGCGIFWRRKVFSKIPVGSQAFLAYANPPNDRILLAQPLKHLGTQKTVVAVSTHLHFDQNAGHQEGEAKELLQFLEDTPGIANQNAAVVICGDLNSLPGSPAYVTLRSKFEDAALGKDGKQSYPSGAFTTVKPDVYYFAKPRGVYAAHIKDEWHVQEGRQEVIDYIMYDAQKLQVESHVQIPSYDGGEPEEPAAKRARLVGASAKAKAKPAAKQPYGYWAGGWAFEGKQPVTETVRYDGNWRPKRSEGNLQLGIPNRIHGSDHLPIACTLRFAD